MPTLASEAHEAIEAHEANKANEANEANEAYNHQLIFSQNRLQQAEKIKISRNILCASSACVFSAALSEGLCSQSLSLHFPIVHEPHSRDVALGPRRP